MNRLTSEQENQVEYAILTTLIHNDRPMTFDEIESAVTGVLEQVDMEVTDSDNGYGNIINNVFYQRMSQRTVAQYNPENWSRIRPLTKDNQKVYVVTDKGYKQVTLPCSRVKGVTPEYEQEVRKVVSPSPVPFLQEEE